tara:strand:- start:203 stop:364 length:162 start_codon:yes stop_codon:yes gene_type:complete
MFKAKVRITANEINKYVKEATRQMCLDIKRNRNEIITLRSQVSSLKAKLEKEK